MAEFGRPLIPGYDPKRDEIYNAFSEYFGDPLTTKTKDVNQFSVYMVRIFELLGNKNRYIVVFAPKDENPKGYVLPLRECRWDVFQTRTLVDEHKLERHRYKPLSLDETPLRQKINVALRDKKVTSYECESFPLTVTLLHTRSDNKFQYNETGTIANALETYQTIVNF